MAKVYTKISNNNILLLQFVHGFLVRAENQREKRADLEVSYHHGKDNSSSWNFYYPQKAKATHLNNCEEMDFSKWHMP